MCSIDRDQCLESNAHYALTRLIWVSSREYLSMGFPTELNPDGIPANPGQISQTFYANGIAGIAIGILVGFKWYPTHFRMG